MNSQSSNWLGCAALSAACVGSSPTCNEFAYKNELTATRKAGCRDCLKQLPLARFYYGEYAGKAFIDAYGSSKPKESERYRLPAPKDLEIRTRAI